MTGGIQLPATTSVTGRRRTRVPSTAIPTKATSTNFGIHQGVPKCACTNAMIGFASQPMPWRRLMFVVRISAACPINRPAKRVRSLLARPKSNEPPANSREQHAEIVADNRGADCKHQETQSDNEGPLD